MDPALVGFDQGDENLHLVAVIGARLGVEQALDFRQGGVVVRFAADGALDGL